MATTVINIKEHWPMEGPEYYQKCVYIGRWNRYYKLGRSKWHNPYKVSEYGKAALPMFLEYLFAPEQVRLLNAIPELKDKMLVCYCCPPEGFNGRLLCHGQFLANLANALPDYATMEWVWDEQGLCTFCYNCQIISTHSEYCNYYLSPAQAIGNLHI